MSIRQRWLAWERIPLVRSSLFLAGILLILVSPLVGAIPGPGGVIVFAFGLGLVLKYSEWAKRQYVRFKRAHPNKGRWADWGMRRSSARRREHLMKERETAGDAGLAPEVASSLPVDPVPANARASDADRLRRSAREAEQRALRRPR